MVPEHHELALGDRERGNTPERTGTGLAVGAARLKRQIFENVGLVEGLAVDAQFAIVSAAADGLAAGRHHPLHQELLVGGPDPCHVSEGTGKPGDPAAAWHRRFGLPALRPGEHHNVAGARF